MQQVGSSPLTRDQTRAPCLGSHWTTREVPSAWYSSENKRILRAQEVQDPEHDSPFLNWHLRQDFSGPLLKIRDLGIHTIFLLYHRILTLAYSGAYTFLELPRWHSGKEPAYNATDMGLILGSRRSHGDGNGSPLQYSCLENSMDRGAWWATVHGVEESDTTKHTCLKVTNFPTHSTEYLDTHIRSQKTTPWANNESLWLG